MGYSRKKRKVIKPRPLFNTPSQADSKSAQNQMEENSSNESTLENKQEQQLVRDTQGTTFTKEDQEKQLREPNDQSLSMHKDINTMRKAEVFTHPFTTIIRKLEEGSFEEEVNSQEKNEKLPTSMTMSLEDNLSAFKETFIYPTNTEFMVRRFTIKALNNKKAALLYVDSMTNGDKIESAVLQPLLLAKSEEGKVPQNIYDFVENTVTIEQIQLKTEYNKLVDEIVSGNTILLIDGIHIGISIGTTMFAHRSVESSQNESVVKGPKEAFTESGKINKSLIRKQMRNPNLVCENVQVGERSKNEISVMYIEALPVSDIHLYMQHTEADSDLFTAMYATTIHEDEEDIDGNEDNYIPGQIKKKGGNPTQMIGSAVFLEGRIIGTLTGEETRNS